MENGGWPGDGSVRSEQKFSFTTAGYSTLRLQELRGTNPDGSHYADPVQWVSYFEGGSAVHYIARGSYGYPQPLGCVELPYSPPRRRTPTCRTARWSR